MAVYVSCAACGWRGCRSYLRDNFAEHACVRTNRYRANLADLRSGWPDDLETWRRLKSRAMDAINRELTNG